MHIRDMDHNEATALYQKLLKSGYPAQIYYDDKKWKIRVEGIISNSNNKLTDFL